MNELIKNFIIFNEDIFPNDGLGITYEKYISNEPEDVKWVMKIYLCGIFKLLYNFFARAFNDNDGDVNYEEDEDESEVTENGELI